MWCLCSKKIIKQQYVLGKYFIIELFFIFANTHTSKVQTIDIGGRCVYKYVTALRRTLCYWLKMFTFTLHVAS